jgi:hypothetical protein
VIHSAGRSLVDRRRHRPPLDDVYEGGVAFASTNSIFRKVHASIVGSSGTFPKHRRRQLTAQGDA